jgi:hypothetical protein
VAGDVIALADEASGLVVARGTEEFVHIEGCAGATALAVGCLGSQVCIWVALHRESEERTDLALLDADSLVARCIGSIAVKPRAEHDVDASERVRVQALTWDSVGGRLWAVGDFGTRSFAPMPGLSQAPPERDG